MNTPHDTPPQATPRTSLLVGGLAALLASTCCLGPLILILLGFSGAWISHLTALEPYRPAFVVLALAALALAARQLWRPAVACTPQQACARADVRLTYKLLFWLVSALVIVALGFPYVAPWFY